jgi:hypothetical protein
MKRVLTSSSDGPYVFVEADEHGVAFLGRLAPLVRDDVDGLGLRAVTVDAPARGFTVKCASRLQPGDDAGWLRRCDPPFNDETCLLEGFRLQQLTLTARDGTATVWFQLIDDTDHTHLPEYVRSDSIDITDFTDLPQPV